MLSSIMKLKIATRLMKVVKSLPNFKKGKKSSDRSKHGKQYSIELSLFTYEEK